MSIATLATFLGWITVINLAVYLVSAATIIFARDFVARTHGKMFGMDERELGRAYFQYLSNYKVVVTVFCLAPYIALKIMS